MIAHPVALLAFMFGLIAFTRWLEGRLALVKRTSSAVVCTLLGIALSNLGVIPHASPIYEGVNVYAIPYAIVLVILASDLRDLRVAGGAMVACFTLATVGSFVGGVASGLLFAGWVGPETWKLTGQFAGAFVGGGMNFVAVGRGLQTDPQVFAAASVANNLSTVPWMLAQVAIYRWLSPYFRLLPSADQSEAEVRHGEAMRERWAHADMSITDLSVLAALPLFAVWASERLSPLLPGFPQVLWLTTLALAMAQVPFVKRFNGTAVLSYFALHLFFIAIGTSAVLSAVLSSGLALFAFMIAIIAIHAVITYGLAGVLRLPLETVTIASQAAVGGPGSALALAMSMKWPTLVTPGIIVGIFGYAIGNYVGFACSYLTRAWLS
ncbi:MAG: DUF819 family protein [Vicinamibacterales bacterium]